MAGPRSGGEGDKGPSASSPRWRCEAPRGSDGSARPEEKLGRPRGRFARAADWTASPRAAVVGGAALHAMAPIEQLRTEERAGGAGAGAGRGQARLALTATIDLQIARAEQAVQRERGPWRGPAVGGSVPPLKTAQLPMALSCEATAHAIRGEEGTIEDRIAEEVALAPRPDCSVALGGTARHVLVDAGRPKPRKTG